ncbi:nucleotide sugar dehydrogenase [Clostridium sp.]|uniref:nucleotide sugar dehydrogenase n=1 Tax=Clostridium sp. TaxID=1506 RepID=UPI001A604547|nr:nucleotide sugar dehydrogenase [Clostridium sp.]MBK5240627.1 nucleotide sugar dehydrogenase [Clostridium sp.]
MEDRLYALRDLNESKTLNEINTKVCIFGQGFVGLPLALSFALRGCSVVGVDVDDVLVENINKGITHHLEKFHGITIVEILQSKLKERRYLATTDAGKAVRGCNNIIVTVGIPIKNGDFIMDYLEYACRNIGRNIKKDDLVIIRSTVIPGTTEDFVLPILESESGMKAGIDFYLAYASERIAEGNAFEEFANMVTLVGGVNKASLYRAIDLLGVVCMAEVIAASGIKEVETAKVFENIQRDVNIAMSQEFARFTEALGIDINEVIKLSNTHKRVNLLTPGAGVGGYCIPNAYHYLAPKAEEFGLNMGLLKLARDKNARVPEFIVDKTEELLKQVGKKLKGSKVAVLGIAMKDYSNDDRNSPSVDICKLLIERGANISAFDPMVQEEYKFKKSTQNDALNGADAVLIITKQQGIDFSDVYGMAKKMNDSPVCIDVKAAIDREEALKFGFVYWRI